MAVSYDTLTDEQKAFSFYYIALCEHGGYVDDAVWDDDNYGVAGDPITLGALQWASGAAAALMETMRDNAAELWDACPQTWKDDLAAHPSSDWDWWYSRYISWEEHEAWANAVAANLDAAKETQATLWFGYTGGESLQGYFDALSYISTDDVKVFFYYMQVHHLSPECASEVWNIAGEQGGDLKRIAAAATNWLRTYYTRQWPTYGEGWTNRFMVWALDPLLEWDGESAPPVWGELAGVGVPSEPGNIGGDGGSATLGGVSMTVSHAFLQANQDLVLVGSQGEKVVMRRSNAGNVWVAGLGGEDVSYDSTPPDEPEPPEPAAGDGWPYAAQAQADLLAILGQWVYSQDNHWSDPWENGGYTDCSGLCWHVTNRYDPATAAKMAYSDGSAGNTTRMQETCSWLGISGYQYDAVPDGWLPGDLFLCNYYTTDSWMAGGHSGSHVGMIFADGTVIDMRGTPGPTSQTLQEMADMVMYWEIRRMPYGEE